MHEIHYRTFAVVIGITGSVAMLAIDNASDPTWQQGGVAAALFGVVLYFLKRGDAREDAYRAAAAADRAILQARIDQLEAQIVALAKRRQPKDNTP